MIIIDGKQKATALKAEIIKRLQCPHAPVPGLAILRVGDDPASSIYIHQKEKQSKECGFHFESHAFASSISQAHVIKKIQDLNEDPNIHGILLQLPLSPHLQAMDLIKHIDPAKDVDGLHPYNQGLLFQKDPQGISPCTPQGCLLLLQDLFESLKGKHAVIIGRSLLVGRPMGMLLLHEGCTVTYVHSQTVNIQNITKQADILIVAAGSCHLVNTSWVKEGAVILDVGIHRTEEGNLKGDVNPQGMHDLVRALSPVPGGVGPMTVACLLLNTARSAFKHHDLPWD